MQLLRAPNEMYIDGTWTTADDGRSMDIIDPATEEVVDTIPCATGGDIDRALEAAQRGFERWRTLDAWTRSDHLRGVARWLADRVDVMAEVMTEEQGKPLAEAVAEYRGVVAYVDWFADEARRTYGRTIPSNEIGTRLSTIRQPVGPVAAFTPWNFPAVLAARKVAAAVAAGCSVVLKPAEEAPRSALFLAQAFDECGVPPGVLNVITGDPAEISTRLIRSPVIRKVSFTGSLAVGRQLLALAAEGVKDVSLELGGHAPVIVFADADLDLAIDACVQAKFRNAGQVCISPSRFFVHTSVANEFADRFARRVRALRVGNGRSPDTDVGPLANSRQLNRVAGLVGDALEHGARLLQGGGRPVGFERGLFFEPTVLCDVGDEMRVMVEEPFGPVAPIAAFDDTDEVVKRVNKSDYGLAGYVFTRDLRTAHLMTEALEVGMVGVNNLVIGRPEAPFGGVKHSGIGLEGGIEGVDAYTVTKYVNVRL